MKAIAKKLPILVAVLLVAVLLSTLTVSAATTEAQADIRPMLEEFAASFDPLVDAFANFSADTFLGANFGNVFSAAVLVLLAIGLLEALFGYRLLRFELLVGGFVLGAYLGKLLVETGTLAEYLTEKWMPLVLMAVIGILVALAAFKLFRPALFCGVALAVFTFGRPIIASLNYSFLEDETVVMVAAAVLGLLIALISLKLLRTVVILLTSLIGAYFVSFSLAGFIDMEHISLILMALVFVIGAAVQIGALSKRR